MLKTAAERDGDLLRRQIALYAPDVIVACGVGNIAKKYIFDDDRPWRLARGHWWLRLKGGPVLIGANHPQARINGQEVYESAVVPWIKACK